MNTLQHRPRSPVRTTLAVLLAVVLTHAFALSPTPSSAAARQGLNDAQARSGADAGATLNNTRLIGFTDLFNVINQIQTGGPNLAGDFNLDGFVDLDDVKDVIDNFGQPDPRPQGAKPIDDDVTSSTLNPDDATPGGNPTVFKRIVPGDGFAADTPQPHAVGRPGMTGYDAKAIARWDVVPYQTFTGEFHVGVVAFHMNGIDRVEFAANGGPWVAVHEMQLNPRTNVWEYTAVLNAADFADGPVEVRAVVYPKMAGIARVLGGPIVDDARLLGEYSMFLSANAGSTLPSHIVWVDAMNGSDDTGDGSESNPYQHLWKASAHLRSLHTYGDGATILCKPGYYSYYRPNGSPLALTSTRWLTIRPAPGASRSEVVLVSAEGPSNNGLNTDLVRFNSITITTQMLATPSAPRRLWLDGCHLRDGASLWSEGWYRQTFATDCLATNMGHVFMGSDLVRGAEVVEVTNDVFVGVALAINSVVRGQNAFGTDNHSDIWQPRTILDNIILYGLDASSPDNIEQGIFSRTTRHHDIAIVNCAIFEHGYPRQNQWRTETHHMVIINNSFLGTPFQFALSDPSNNVQGFLRSTNILLTRNVFQWVSITDTQNTAPDGANFASIAREVAASNNHFINLWPSYHPSAGLQIGIPFGDSYTTGLNIPDGVGAPGFH